MLREITLYFGARKAGVGDILYSLPGMLCTWGGNDVVVCDISLWYLVVVMFVSKSLFLCCCCYAKWKHLIALILLISVLRQPNVGLEGCDRDVT